MRKFSWLLSAACLLLAACTAMQGGARLDPLPDEFPAEAIFPGIINSAGAQPTRRYVFNIHGMGCTKRDYNEGVVASLGQYGFGEAAASDLSSASFVQSRSGEDADCDGELDAAPPSTVGWFDIPLAAPVDLRGEGYDCDTSANAPPCRYTTFGSLRIDRLRHGDEELVIYTYFWNADFWALQRVYLAADLQQDDRALINGGLKRQLVDRGFSDAVAYLGPLGRLARDSIRVAVCEMLWDAAGPQSRATSTQPTANCLEVAPQTLPPEVEVSFISHSLGSRMLLDALAPEPGATRGPGETAAMQALADRTSAIYMAANQIPLLGIGRVWSPEAAASAISDPCATRTFIYCQGEQLSAHRLHIVGFYDPDDLLGFRADSGLALVAPSEREQAESLGLRFINVRHRNAAQWLWTLTWPTAAHDQELNRDTSRRLIFCGATANSAGRLTPRMAGCEREP